MKNLTASECAAWLAGHDDYLIVSHRRPDGDTLCSGAALCSALRRRGKSAWCLRNAELTETYRPYMEPYMEEGSAPHAVTVTVDVASEGLIPEGVGAPIALAIDHHPSNSRFADNLCLAAESSSCGELVMDIIRELCGNLTAEEARLLYIAVSTDTGCFQYSNTTADTHRVAAALMEEAVDALAQAKGMHDELEQLYNQATTDSQGEAVVGRYLVIVTDTDTTDPVANATVALHTDNTLSIRLPSGRLLDYADQTTIQVQLVKDKSPVVDMSISVTDRNDNYSSGKTDSAGQLTVPGGSDSTNEDGKGTVGWEDADGDRHTLTVKVEDYETKRPIPDAGISIGKTGTITVTLPDGEDMDVDNRITVTVTDQERQPREGLSVIVKGDLGQTERGETDGAGQLTVPDVAELETHGAYVVGYTDGSFGPERSMRRSEAATIFARLLSQRLGERIAAPTTTTFPDVPADAWYAGYVSYLTRYGVAVGYTDGLFHGDEPISRAEFTAMAVRFFDAYGDGDQEIMEDYQDFWDVSPGHWAAGYIEDAARHGWVVGYGDGTFQPEDEISRAEVMTIVNRLLGREADQDYIASGPRGLVRFPDVPSSHWAYYDILEASNHHEADVSGDPEVWQEK